MTNDEGNRPVRKYIGLFALVYYVFLLAAGVLLGLIKVDMTGVFYAMAIFGSGRVAAYQFLKENRRIYTRAEKIKLIVGTFLCAAMIDTLFTTNVIGAMSIVGLDYSFLAGQLMNLIILWYTFGPLSKRLGKPW